MNYRSAYLKATLVILKPVLIDSASISSATYSRGFFIENYQAFFTLEPPVIEATLDENLPYQSMPSFLQPLGLVEFMYQSQLRIPHTAQLEMWWESSNSFNGWWSFPDSRCRIPAPEWTASFTYPPFSSELTFRCQVNLCGWWARQVLGREINVGVWI